MKSRNYYKRMKERSETKETIIKGMLEYLHKEYTNASSPVLKKLLGKEAVALSKRGVKVIGDTFKATMYANRGE
jgi:hypothetical protein